MSTRALITVKDQWGGHHVYRHCDGYPDTEHGVIAGLQQVIQSEYVWPLPRFEADDFAAGIIRCLKSGAGNYRLSNGPEAHGGIEYWYVVTSNGSRSITVEWRGHGKHKTVNLSPAARIGDRLSASA